MKKTVILSLAAIILLTSCAKENLLPEQNRQQEQSVTKQVVTNQQGAIKETITEVIPYEFLHVVANGETVLFSGSLLVEIKEVISRNNTTVDAGFTSHFTGTGSDGTRYVASMSFATHGTFNAGHPQEVYITHESYRAVGGGESKGVLTYLVVADLNGLTGEITYHVTKD